MVAILRDAIGESARSGAGTVGVRYGVGRETWLLNKNTTLVGFVGFIVSVETCSMLLATTRFNIDVTKVLGTCATPIGRHLT